MPLLSGCLRCLFLWIQFNTNGPNREAQIPFPHRIITVSCDFVKRENTYDTVQIVCTHLQTHTNWLWVCRSLDSVLQRNKYIMDNIGKIPYVVLAHWKSGSGDRIFPIHFRPKRVCLKVSSKAPTLVKLSPGSATGRRAPEHPRKGTVHREAATR